MIDTLTAAWSDSEVEDSAKTRPDPGPAEPVGQ